MHNFVENLDTMIFKQKINMETFEQTGNHNLFMMCKQVNDKAFRPMPEGYSIVSCTKERFNDWLLVAAENCYQDLLIDFYQKVYARNQDAFLERCYLVYDSNNQPVATALLWKAYDQFESIGWVRTLPNYENRGIGRALLSYIMQKANMPVYLHTQPTSVVAMQLYLDLGFVFLNDPMIGIRKNDFLQDKHMLEILLDRNLDSCGAPSLFLETLKNQQIIEF